MKTFPLLTAAICCLVFERALSQETAPPIDPIIELVMSTDYSLDFNSIKHIMNYHDTEDEDLVRRTPIELISSAVNPGQAINGPVPSEVFEVDSVSFDINGQHQTSHAQEHNIIFNTDTVTTIKIKTIETNYLKRYPDTIARYENVYYSFFEDSTIVFEVFEKKRIWNGDLLETFVGISVNKLVGEKLIDLKLIPNPATDHTKVSFELLLNGSVDISISNTSATINQLVFSGQLSSGQQEIPINLDGYVAGVYTITVQYKGAHYSTNLIIQ